MIQLVCVSVVDGARENVRTFHWVDGLF